MLLYRWRRKITSMSKSLTSVLDSRIGQDSFTLNPKDGTVWVFDNPNHRLAAFLKHSKNRHNVYFYATTNGNNTISRALRIGYARLLETDSVAYVGRWDPKAPINSDDKAVIDAVEAVDDGIDDVGIKAKLKQYNQHSAAKLEAKYDEKII